MYKSFFIFTTLLCGQMPVAAIDDELAIDATIRGVLVRSPGAFSDKVPFVEFDQSTSDGRITLLCKLALPGDEFVSEVVNRFMDQPVVITGKLRIHPNVLQKDQSRKTEYSFFVRTLHVEKNNTPVIGPTSPNGRWYAVKDKTGLRLYDTTTNKGREIYAPADVSAASAINWNASITFSSNGNYALTRQGLQSHLWRLPDLKTIELKLADEDERIQSLGFREYSHDAKFLVMDAYRNKAKSDLMIVFQTQTGKEVARFKFDTDDSDRKFSFLPDGNTLVVDHDGSLTLLSLETGKQLASVKKN